MTARTTFRPGQTWLDTDGPAIEGGDEAVPTLAGAKGGAAPRPAEPPLFANGDTLSNR